MTEFSTFSRRRADRNETNTISSKDNQNSAMLPSKIPIKSPARSSKPIGGMTVAYSPIKSSSEGSVLSNIETVTSNTSNNDNYSKKLMELKNAMDLLKTPPAATGIHQSQSSHISYTPIKSSSLAANNPTSPFASAIDAIEISMASSSDTETAGNDTSLLDAYREDEVHGHDDSRNNIFSSPRDSITSSPYISSEQLKRRLEATKEAFQRSLEAQKRRLRTSLPFTDIDSSFSTCGGFDSDLSVESLKYTRNQLEKIKKEMSEIIESDFEDVKFQRTNDNNTNDLIKRESWTWSSVIFKYFVIFSITTIFFIHFLVNYLPNVQITIVDFFSTFEKENFLEKVEETLNFLLQD